MCFEIHALQVYLCYASKLILHSIIVKRLWKTMEENRKPQYWCILAYWICFILKHPLKNQVLNYRVKPIYPPLTINFVNLNSTRNINLYMLSREYRVSGNRFSRLLFTNKDRFYANLHDQKQSTNMSSLCQYLAFVWRYSLNCGDVIFLCQNRQKWRNEQSITVLAGLCARSGHNLACKN